MTRTGRSIALLAALEAVVLALLVFALADRRANQRDPVYGVNQWGYRDEARGHKEPGEIRVVIVGGSAAFEAGTVFSDTLASQLLFELQRAGSPAKQEYSVVNVSEPRVSADSYAQALRHYAFLDPDVICVYDGYDVLGGVPPHSRQRSSLFQAAGYLPILPARVFGVSPWMSDPDGGVADALQEGGAADVDVSCAGASRAYCAAMADTVRVALDEPRPIVVVSPPAVSARHLAQQQSLGASLGDAFGRDPRFRYLDLTAATNLKDHTKSPDGVRRTVLGTHEVVQPLSEALLKWIALGWLERGVS